MTAFGWLYPSNPDKCPICATAYLKFKSFECSGAICHNCWVEGKLAFRYKVCDEGKDIKRRSDWIEWVVSIYERIT